MKKRLETPERKGAGIIQYCSKQFWGSVKHLTSALQKGFTFIKENPVIGEGPAEGIKNHGRVRD